MIKFDFNRFLIEKRKSIADLSKMLRIPVRSISIMKDRGSVKPSFLSLLETHFGDCTIYIKENEYAGQN